MIQKEANKSIERASSSPKCQVANVLFSPCNNIVPQVHRGSNYFFFKTNQSPNHNSPFFRSLERIFCVLASLSIPKPSHSFLFCLFFVCTNYRKNTENIPNIPSRLIPNKMTRLWKSSFVHWPSPT